MFDNVYPHPIDRNDVEEMNKLRAFLKSVYLNYEETVDYTAVFLDPNEQIIGTGSFEGNILKCIAVDPKWRDTGLLGKIITHLVEKEGERECYTVLAFTRIENLELFKGLGLRELARSPMFALLETGFGGIWDYQSYLKSTRKDQKPTAKNGCVIVNCNPFTRGHLYLMETAAARCDHLYVIVVETDLSLFPFRVRHELIRRGVSHLDNVTVVKGGDYVISRYTFPIYFLRDETMLEISRAQSELDVRLFANWIAPVLGIKYRFVGTEDYCVTTASYNEAMKKVLPQYGLELLEIQRRQQSGTTTAISASRVREAIRHDDWQLISELVPPTTHDFLRSPEATAIIDKIKRTTSKH